jgi:hypothetical protein
MLNIVTDRKSIRYHGVGDVDNTLRYINDNKLGIAYDCRPLISESVSIHEAAFKLYSIITDSMYTDVVAKESDLLLSYALKYGWSVVYNLTFKFGINNLYRKVGPFKGNFEFSVNTWLYAMSLTHLDCSKLSGCTTDYICFCMTVGLPMKFCGYPKYSDFYVRDSVSYSMFEYLVPLLSRYNHVMCDSDYDIPASTLGQHLCKVEITSSVKKVPRVLFVIPDLRLTSRSLARLFNIYHVDDFTTSCDPLHQRMKLEQHKSGPIFSNYLVHGYDQVYHCYLDRPVISGKDIVLHRLMRPFHIWYLLRSCGCLPTEIATSSSFSEAYPSTGSFSSRGSKYSDNYICIGPFVNSNCLGFNKRPVQIVMDGRNISWPITNNRGVSNNLLELCRDDTHTGDVLEIPICGEYNGGSRYISCLPSFSLLNHPESRELIMPVAEKSLRTRNFSYTIADSLLGVYPFYDTFPGTEGTSPRYRNWRVYSDIALTDSGFQTMVNSQTYTVRLVARIVQEVYQARVRQIKKEALVIHMNAFPELYAGVTWFDSSDKHIALVKFRANKHVKHFKPIKVDPSGHLMHLMLYWHYSDIDMSRFMMTIRTNLMTYAADRATLSEFSSLKRKDLLAERIGFDGGILWHGYLDYLLGWLSGFIALTVFKINISRRNLRRALRMHISILAELRFLIEKYPMFNTSGITR